MNGVKFDEKHSIKDWDLLMTSKNIGEPEVKTNYLSIPGRDGMLDLTEALGGIKYNNRTLTFEFDLFQNPCIWWDLKTEISNYLHGKKRKIILDADNKFYYFGRCRISSFTNDTTVAHLTIECECDPYKYKLNLTKKQFQIPPGVNNKKIAIYNLEREIVPTIYVDKDVVIEFNGESFQLTKGENIILNIVLKKGENIFTIGSSVNIEFEYQEATL